MYFSHICHFRPMTQPNPLKTQIFDPFPTKPNPTQPNPTRGSTQPMDNSALKCGLMITLGHFYVIYSLMMVSALSDFLLLGADYKCCYLLKVTY